MKKYLFLALTLFCAGGLIAQKNASEVISGPGDGKEKQSFAPKRTAVSPAGTNKVPAKNSKSAAPAASRQNHAAVKKEAAKTTEQDSEEGGVVIDSKSEDSEAETLSYPSKNNAEQPEEAAFASYIPASYGQLKGVLIEQGRNVMVFENDEGILSFVQVSVGKNSVTWKLLARVARSQD